MDYKFKGERYDRNLSLKEIAQKIREYVKNDEELSQCKWSIRTSYASGCQSLTIALQEAPFEVFTDTYRDYETWNHYHGSSSCTEDGNRIMFKMRDLVKSYNFDDSDVMTDYFHVNFYEDYYVGTYEKPFKKVERKAKKVKRVKEKIDVGEDGLHIVTYSEKSFVVCGDTKPIKELLKHLGGRFNPRLDLDCRVGWVFPITKLEMVRDFLNL